MAIGFACKFIGVPGTDTRTCLLANATPAKLAEVGEYNIASLGRMLDYCHSAGIGLFRISSDIIPLASHPDIRSDWQKRFALALSALGKKVQAYNMRVSMHPGQYTVLNSPSDDVVHKAVLDLCYHADFLDLMGLDPSHKLVLHIGGVYGDKPLAMQRFVDNFKKLPENVRQRLCLENDDKSYNIADVLDICRQVNVPAIFDVLHHDIIGSPGNTPLDWLQEAAATWTAKDGRQKIHYAQQMLGGKVGTHSKTIACGEFMEFYNSLEVYPDIMLEVKDKNLSAIKCQNCTTSSLPLKELQTEWARYKYSVLAKNQAQYQAIRQLFANQEINALRFYGLVEEALALPDNPENAINAAEHVLGYFKNKATSKEKEDTRSMMEKVQRGEKTVDSLPKKLLKLAEKYKDKYLLESLYLYGV